jgi:hypothetical protein
MSDPELLSWIERGQLIAALLVAIGVAGEFVGSFIARPINRRLESAREQQIAALNREAGEARQTAESYRLQIAEAHERAANAERETARIKEKLADRSLSNDEVKALISELRKYAGQEFEITAYWDSRESMSISNRINEALQRAGWKYLKPQGFSAMMGGVVGVFVFVHPQAQKETLSAANALTSLLNGHGINAQLMMQVTENNPPHNKIHLNIGSK